MSALRADYFRLALVGDVSDAFLEVYRSLRFSTHCQITAISDRPGDQVAPWVIWSDGSDKQLALDAIRHADLVLRVSAGECYLDDTLGDPSSAHQTVSVPRGAQLAVDRFSAELEAALADFRLMGVSAPPRFIRFDFFRTFAGETKYVGASCSPDRKLWMPITSESEFDLVEELRAVLVQARFVGSLSCEIARQSAGGDFALRLDRSCLHWNALRAVGINIPLLYVQDFLRRNFEIFHFVDIGHLKVVDNAALHYAFELAHIFVDLDETLIINNRRVDYVTTFLQRCAETGSRISIVSRHANDIATTLQHAGIELALFDEIHPVAQGEMKSNWVSAPRGAVFIDNEFAERLDVRHRKGIPVLDLNQLDFFGLAARPPVSKR